MSRLTVITPFARSLALTAALAVPLALTAVGAAAAKLGRQVDESALRYYAATNQIERYQAEMNRLKTLYPDFVPTPDMGAVAQNPEADLWKFFAADKLDALQAEIARRKQIDPGFTISDDLAGKLAHKLARRDLIKAATSGNSAKVLSIAAAHPDLGGCTDLEVAWQIAAARRKTQDTDGAIASYRTLLRDCTAPADRRATLQKAIAQLGSKAEPLVAQSGLDGNATNDAEIALTRQQIVGQLADQNAAPVDAERLARFTARAQAKADAGDLALIGWLQRAKGNHADALASFERAAQAVSGQSDAPALVTKIDEGTVLSLIALDRRKEAFARVEPIRDRSPALGALFLDLGADRFQGTPRPRLPDAEIAAYAAVAGKLHSALGAETLGWYAYDFGESDVAERWFDMSMTAKPSQGAARGLVLAAMRRGDRSLARQRVEKWRPTYADLGLIDLAPNRQRPANAKPVSDPIIVAFQSAQYRRCVDLAQNRRPLSTDQSLILGWCLLKLERPNEALTAFNQASAGPISVRRDAEYGRSLALLAAGDLQAAGAAANAPLMTGARRNEIGVALLADQAIAAFDNKRYVEALAILTRRARFSPESRRLTMIRGWSLWHLGRPSAAERVFTDADRSLSTSETRRALAIVRNARNPS
ncbi:hypothetical protein LQ948_04835 [Jiella sp. MQZ9-1]|uniref:Tetratricopeptide repeat protein n=1 Tax=Jiella flava TaxID=2816857 RepID=A0A939FXT5_9HYPH|nr:hypothetical protein [Jiella flava]MBO0662140.1 hypothetical protein [Jiella flava]MCD2470531.1 hypothetical protein [Jiella flava]